MNYRSFADMNNDIVRNLAKFPHDVDLVVGVPRSGMLPANLLALYLNKPYTSVELFCNGGGIYANGSRNIDRSDIHKILVVDDSVSSGTAMSKAKEMLKDCCVDKVFACVYATPKGTAHVDVYCEVVKHPRLFQWNVFNTQRVENAMFDMDGVLCADPAVDDDGELYIAEITNAKPLYIPKYTIDTIITCRLEKYRAITEEWLHKHGVAYSNLVMLPFNSKRERLKWGRHGEWKGENYKSRPNTLFYESSLEQAKKISAIAQKPVFCTETMSFV